MKTNYENATAADLKNGFFFNAKTQTYTCLFCGKQYEEGDIYQAGNRLVNAEKSMRFHITKKHGTVFESLLLMDKAQTGLTDTQKEFLRNSYNNIPDKEIAQKMNITPSTVRYQRFSYKEKVRQAKLILALSELLEEKDKTAPPEKVLTEAEKMTESLFVSVSPLVLKTFDFKKNKDKKRLFILETIIKQFEKGKKYTEKEINTVLKGIYTDYAILRRCLIEQGLMERTDDGKEYWVK
ncbi:MAG: DUF2087 domain-containing protein [Clostridiales bacterium]|nr:DUF2087 domain-containing protein [Clostridiales bacterium]